MLFPNITLLNYKGYCFFEALEQLNRILCTIKPHYFKSYYHNQLLMKNVSGLCQRFEKAVWENNQIWRKSHKSWDPEAQSVIIAEGLLMYLNSSAVHDLFRQCASVSGTGTRIAFTYIGKGPDGRPDAGRCTGFLLWTLKATGEPWLWSIQPEQIGVVLKENGWTYSPDLAGQINKRGVEFFGTARK